MHPASCDSELKTTWVRFRPRSSNLALAADAPGVYSFRDGSGGLRYAAVQELEDAGFKDIAEEQDEPAHPGEAVNWRVLKNTITSHVAYH